MCSPILRSAFRWLIVVSCSFTISALMPVAVVSADWNPGDGHKMHFPQEPDPEGWDICLVDQWLADDFQCTQSGPIQDIHFWISWREGFIGDVPDAAWEIDIFDDASGVPGNLVWQLGPGQATFHVRQYDNGPQGWHCPAFQVVLPPPDHFEFFQVNITNIQEPFFQTEGEMYWLVIRASIPGFPSPVVGWKTSLNFPPTQPFGAPALWTTDLVNWQPIETPFFPDFFLHDLAFVITNTGGPVEDRDYGDAPEGAPAYPWMGPTLGAFPTCLTVGTPTSYIRHNNFGGWFGFQPPDFEPDGNAGLCTVFAPYDADECFMDGDAGLLVPEPFTIDNFGNPVPCPGFAGLPLGPVCAQAVWGPNIDIEVHNMMPNQTTGYVNVLIDWNQDGIWGGASTCPPLAPEHVLVDFPILNGYVGPLSGAPGPAPPPPVQIGPNSGYVWARFTFTEVPLGIGWTGEGDFEDGETEDYLLWVDGGPVEEFDWGDLPDPYATVAAMNGPNHLIVPNMALGAGADAEPDGQPDPAAQGDDQDLVFPPPNDDEDGITFVTTLVPGQQAIIDVTNNMLAGGIGFLDGWIDFGADGGFAEAGDQVFFSMPLSPAPINFNSFFINVPPTAVPGATYARFRFSSMGGLTPVGGAFDGEVEDYQVRVEQPPPTISKWSQLPHESEEGFDAISNIGLAPPEDLAKWQQAPNTLTSGLHAHDYVITGTYMADTLADQWRCEGSPVTKLVWYGNYELDAFNNEKRGAGIASFDVSIYDDDNQPMPLCLPNNLLWNQSVAFAAVTEIDTGLTNNEGCTIYRYEYMLPNPFDQQQGLIYWLAIGARANDPNAPAIWRWQTDGPPTPNLCFAASKTDPTAPMWSSGSNELAFEIISAGPIPAPEPNRVVADDFVSDGRAIEAVRWWGSYFDDRFAPPTVPVEPFVLDGWLISFHHAVPEAQCPPDAMAGDDPTVLGVYFAPVDAVIIVPTGYADCLGHDVYGYAVDLSQCCLICAEPDPRDGNVPADPDAFNEVRSFKYWLSIQAVVGVTWQPLTDPTCVPIYTGHRPSDLTLEGHFWGWHTSPGPLAPCGPMNPACAGELAFIDLTAPPSDCPDYQNWQSETWQCPTGDDPVNMAFELLTREPDACATCPGDMDGNNVIDGRDIQKFVDCLTNPGLGWNQCACADVDCSKSVTMDDIDEFVALLLSGTGC